MSSESARGDGEAYLFVCTEAPFFFCPAGTTSEEGVIFVYAVFNKPVSAVESTVYITAIFKQHALRILHKYLPLYRDADRRDMLAQVRGAYFTVCVSFQHRSWYIVTYTVTHSSVRAFFISWNNLVFQVICQIKPQEGGEKETFISVITSS